MGISILLPGPLTNIIIFTVSYFFGFRGGFLAYFIIIIISVLFICIYIKYGYKLIRHSYYRKIYSSMNCMNRGFCLFMVINL